MVLERHELLVQHASDEEFAVDSRAVGVTEARVTGLKFRCFGGTRPSVDDTRQVAQVVSDGGRQRQRRRGGRPVVDCRGEQSPLALDLGIDSLRQRRRLRVET